MREGYADRVPAGEPPPPPDAARSKYTNLGRLWASLSDLSGVIWLRSRARPPGGVDEL